MKAVLHYKIDCKIRSVKKWSDFIIIFLFIMGLCSFIMVVIGVMQYKSEKPIGFWTGQSPPETEKIINVPKYNHLHGIMWIAYGAAMIAGAILDCIFKTYISLPLIPLGVALLAIGHRAIDKKYLKK